MKKLFFGFLMLFSAKCYSFPHLMDYPGRKAIEDLCEYVDTAESSSKQILINLEKFGSIEKNISNGISKFVGYCPITDYEVLLLGDTGRERVYICSPDGVVEESLAFENLTAIFESGYIFFISFSDEKSLSECRSLMFIWAESI